MDERQGAAILKQVFERAGCAIVEAFSLELDARTVSLDGWDAARRVGFEIVTTEAGDREEFTPDVVAELEARMERGELHVFLVDEAHVPDAATLERAAGRFLEALRARGVLP